jgi:predicted dehydrogenase/threonine dehydrogenase-like Zn-dependent dehydrogenase
MIVELAGRSLVGKARARPDLVRKVLAGVRRDGVAATLQKALAKLDTPIPLGYSCAGTIVQSIGLDGLAPGDRVACAGAGHATHAEFNVVPRNLVARVPDRVGFEDAAFTTIGAIALQGVRQADVRLGENVIVIGLGLIGLLTVQLLEASGCRVLGSDVDPERCRLARDLGAVDAVVDGLIEAAGAFTDGRGADAVIITAATPSNGPIEIAADVARQRGRVVVVGMVGMNIPREPYYRKELELRLSMSYGPGRYDPAYEEHGHDYPFAYVRWTEQRNMQAFLELVAAGKVTPSRLVTHRFDIAGALGAYDLLRSKSERSLGILITYPHESTDDQRLERERLVALRRPTGSQGIGVAVIGAGDFARTVLVPALVRAGGTQRIGICAASGMRAAEAARRFDFAQATTDHRRLLDDERVQAVFIATRHDSHASLACAALDAGKHVFVEKPLCIRPEDLDRYVDAVSRANGRLLMAGFNRRFSPHLRALRDAFASRRTPMVVSYLVNAGPVPKDHWIQDPSVGGGRIVGEACHFVDFCEALIGSAPRTVHARSIAAATGHVSIEDSMVATIAYDDGSLATIQYVAVGTQAGGKERIEVSADGVRAVVDDFVRTDFHGTRRRSLKGRQDKGFDDEMRVFLSAIREGGAWPIPLASMIRTTRVTFAMVESMRTGEEIVLAASSPAAYA